jgi:hypothetical protein
MTDYEVGVQKIHIKALEEIVKLLQVPQGVLVPSATGKLEAVIESMKEDIK